MNAVWIDGRWSHTKLSEGALETDEMLRHAISAKRGSFMLKNAILKAKGYKVPEPVSPPPAPAPVFVPRPVRRGRARGTFKVRKREPLVEQIKALVAAHFHITIADLEGRAKVNPIAHPRQIAMFLARKRAGISYPDIGFQFGGKDHTTVMYACEQVEKRIAAHDVETLKALGAVYTVLGA
jgi:hypothetical protein